jgi:hypothetical protein
MRKETHEENNEEEENEDNRDEEPETIYTNIVAIKRAAIGKNKGGITLFSQNGELHTTLKPDNPKSPIGLWQETPPQSKKPGYNNNILSQNNSFSLKTIAIYQLGTNTRYNISEKQWATITKFLNEENIFTDQTHEPNMSPNKPSRTINKNELKGKKWGNEKERGYLYDPEDPAPDLQLNTAEWMPTTLGKDLAIRRGLFTNKPIKKNHIITTYAGEGKFVGTNHNQHNSPDETAYYKTLIKFNTGTNPHYVINGFRELVKGYGLGQFCNDKREKGTTNAEIITINTEGGTKKGKMGIYLKALRNIEKGEEILITYDKHYFIRYKEWTRVQPEDEIHPQSPQPNQPTNKSTQKDKSRKRPLTPPREPNHPPKKTQQIKIHNPTYPTSDQHPSSSHSPNQSRLQQWKQTEETDKTT